MTTATPESPSAVLRLRQASARVRYYGHRCRCPMCGARLRRFLPHGKTYPVLEELDVVGGGRREQARCPVCRSIDRERLVHLYLREMTGVLTEPCRMLHVAPERNLGPLLAGLPHIDYLSADLDAPHAMVKMDLCDVPFEAGSFDVILCNHVLEHIPDDRRAMREVHRVLRPGGFAVVQTPISHTLAATREDLTVTDPQDRERVFGQKDHVRIYAKDYTDRLREAGFAVDVVAWLDEPKLATPGESAGLNPRELLYIARK